MTYEPSKDPSNPVYGKTDWSWPSPHYQETSLSFRLLHSSPPWPTVPDQRSLTTLSCFQYFLLLQVWNWSFLAWKYFLSTLKIVQIRLLEILMFFCTNAILLWCKSNLNMTWNDRGIKKLWRSFKQKQYQVFQFEASKRNICIAVHEKVNYLPTVWKTMPSCTKVHIKHKYKWNNVQCSSCFKVFTKNVKIT